MYRYRTRCCAANSDCGRKKSGPQEKETAEKATKADHSSVRQQEQTGGQEDQAQEKEEIGEVWWAVDDYPGLPIGT